MSDEQGGGFLDRWSRRKVQARAGQTPADEAPPSVAAAVAAPVDGSKTLPALADKAPPNPLQSCALCRRLCGLFCVLPCVPHAP